MQVSVHSSFTLSLLYFRQLAILSETVAYVLQPTPAICVFSDAAHELDIKTDCPRLYLPKTAINGQINCYLLSINFLHQLLQTHLDQDMFFQFPTVSRPPSKIFALRLNILISIINVFGMCILSRSSFIFISGFCQSTTFKPPFGLQLHPGTQEAEASRAL